MFSCFTCIIKKLPVLVGPLSAIQPFSHPLTLNFPWSLGYIKKLAFGSPYSLPVLCAANMLEYLNCTDTALSGYQFTPQQCGVSEIISCALRNSRQAGVGFEPRISRSVGECATTGPTHPDIILDQARPSKVDITK